jgi:hypothetical protein
MDVGLRALLRVMNEMDRLRSAMSIGASCPWADSHLPLADDQETIGADRCRR